MDKMRMETPLDIRHKASINNHYKVVSPLANQEL